MDVGGHVIGFLHGSQDCTTMTFLLFCVYPMNKGDLGLQFFFFFLQGAKVQKNWSCAARKIAFDVNPP